MTIFQVIARQPCAGACRLTGGPAEVQIFPRPMACLVHIMGLVSGKKKR
jgi:hypothetical protein